MNYNNRRKEWGKKAIATTKSILFLKTLQREKEREIAKERKNGKYRIKCVKIEFVCAVYILFICCSECMYLTPTKKKMEKLNIS